MEYKPLLRCFISSTKKRPLISNCVGSSPLPLSHIHLDIYCLVNNALTHAGGGRSHPSVLPRFIASPLNQRKRILYCLRGRVSGLKLPLIALGKMHLDGH
jgi:hypothetical protein